MRCCSLLNATVVANSYPERRSRKTRSAFVSAHHISISVLPFRRMLLLSDQPSSVAGPFARFREALREACGHGDDLALIV